MAASSGLSIHSALLGIREKSQITTASTCCGGHRIGVIHVSWLRTWSVLPSLIGFARTHTSPFPCPSHVLRFVMYKDRVSMTLNGWSIYLQKSIPLGVYSLQFDQSVCPTCFEIWRVQLTIWPYTHWCYPIFILWYSNRNLLCSVLWLIVDVCLSGPHNRISVRCVDDIV